MRNLTGLNWSVFSFLLFILLMSGLFHLRRRLKINTFQDIYNHKIYCTIHISSSLLESSTPFFSFPTGIKSYWCLFMCHEFLHSLHAFHAFLWHVSHWTLHFFWISSSSFHKSGRYTSLLNQRINNNLTITSERLFPKYTFAHLLWLCM